MLGIKHNSPTPGALTKAPGPVPGPSPDDEISIWKVITRHPIIVICCIYANIGSLMYGFDNIALSLCLSMPAFIERFGDQGVIPAYWQSLWNAMPQITTALGSWAAGPLSDRWGRRVTFIASGLVSIVGIAIVYTAGSRGSFLAGKMVNAAGLGMALTAGQTYVSEITPLKFRGVALSAYGFCMNLGFLISASISFNRVTILDDSAYRVVFASAWAWPSLLVLAAPLIPESPYHLVRKKDFGGARRSLEKLHSNHSNIEPVLDDIARTIENEAYIGDSTFIECFRGVNWRRTRIVLYANGLPQMIGATFTANAPYFMIVAGMSPNNTAMMVELGIGLAIISSVITFKVMTILSRRIMILAGVTLAGTLFFIMGVAASIPTQNSSSLWCTGITLQLVWLSIGPAIGPAMSVAGEVSAVRLRAKTSALGFLFNYIYSTIWNIVVPYMFNVDEGNLGGKMGWIFFGTALVALVIVWFEVPDTKDLTFAQIDERFEMRVRTRDFQSYQEVRGEGIGAKDVELVIVQQAENA